MNKIVSAVVVHPNKLTITLAEQEYPPPIGKGIWSDLPGRPNPKTLTLKRCCSTRGACHRCSPLIPRSSSANTFSGHRPAPAGMIHLVLRGASRVPSKMGWLSRPDPYLRMVVEGVSDMPGTPVRSSVKQNTRNPTWNEEFFLLVHSAKETLKVNGMQCCKST